MVHIMGKYNAQNAENRQEKMVTTQATCKTF